MSPLKMLKRSGSSSRLYSFKKRPNFVIPSMSSTVNKSSFDFNSLAISSPFADVLNLILVKFLPLSVRDFSKMGEFSALYYLCHNGQINRIGESSNLKKRLSDYKRQEIPFDEVHYCRMDSFSNDERKGWESYLINQYVTEKGMLPPYNFQNGRGVN